MIDMNFLDKMPNRFKISTEKSSWRAKIILQMTIAIEKQGKISVHIRHTFFAKWEPDVWSKFREKFIKFENEILTHHKARTWKYFVFLPKIFRIRLKYDDGII